MRLGETMDFYRIHSKLEAKMTAYYFLITAQYRMRLFRLVEKVGDEDISEDHHVEAHIAVPSPRVAFQLVDSLCD